MTRDGPRSVKGRYFRDQLTVKRKRKQYSKNWKYFFLLHQKSKIDYGISRADSLNKKIMKNASLYSKGLQNCQRSKIEVKKDEKHGWVHNCHRKRMIDFNFFQTLNFYPRQLCSPLRHTDSQYLIYRLNDVCMTSDGPRSVKERYFRDQLTVKTKRKHIPKTENIFSCFSKNL